MQKESEAAGKIVNKVESVSMGSDGLLSDEVDFIGLASLSHEDSRNFARETSSNRLEEDRL